MIYRWGRIGAVAVATVLAAAAVWTGACSQTTDNSSQAAEGDQPIAESGRQLQPHMGSGGVVTLEPGETEALVIYSGATHGTLEACGCDGNIAGGMTKERTVVRWIRESGRPTLHVHPGDLMPYKTLPGKPRYVAEAAALMGYDALAVGDQELREGLPQFRELAMQYRLPYVASNLRGADGKHLAPPYVIKTLAGVKVGIFAIVADAGEGWYVFDEKAFPEGVTRQGAREAVAEVLAELEGKVDYIVLLSQQDKSLDCKLAYEFPQINLIVGGHDEKLITKPIRIGHTLVVNAGVAGDFVGIVRLGIDPSRHVRVLAHEFGVASGTVPKDPEIEKIYYRYVKEQNVRPEVYSKDDPDLFQSSLTCEPCHKKIYEQHMTTKHAQAWKTLVDAKRTEDRECWSCHTMGYRRPGGFKSIKETPELANVSCQACHPVTHDHNDRGIKSDPDFPLNQRACERCHTVVTSPDFNFWKDIEEIDHHAVKEKSNDPPADYKHWLALPEKKDAAPAAEP
ncbi:MAG: hypothetical protein JXL80_00425 [Planctomycetes bacterium]|nr:hypothetical protein [Planctomycetota bacterium]